MTSALSRSGLLAAVVLTFAAASLAQESTANERYAAAVAVRKELGLPACRWLADPAANATPIAAAQPDDLAVARAALDDLDAAEAAVREAAEQTLSGLLQRPDPPPAVAQLVLATADECWPADPTDLGEPAADGTPGYAARVIAVAARTGDAALVRRILASATLPAANAPAEVHARAQRYAWVILRNAGLAAPHVDAATARQLHACYAATVAPLTEAAVIMPNAWQRGALDVVLGIYPVVPDDLVPWYRTLFANPLMSREGCAYCLGHADRLDEPRIRALLPADQILRDPRWLRGAPGVLVDLLEGGEEQRRLAMTALRNLPADARSATLLRDVAPTIARLPIGQSAPFLEWIARRTEAPLAVRIAAFPPPDVLAGAPRDVVNHLLDAIAQESDGTDADLAALAPFRAAPTPLIAQAAWRKTMELALQRGTPVADGEVGIDVVGANHLLPMAYALRFLGREPGENIDRLRLFDDPYAVIDVARVRAWRTPTWDLGPLALRTRNPVSRSSVLTVLAEPGEWSQQTGRILGLLLDMSREPEVRAAVYRALASRPQEPFAALVAEAEFDVDPLVQAFAAR